MDFSKTELLSFDCYGTLVDWERGIVDTLKPLLRRHGQQVDNNPLLGYYAKFESELEKGDFKPYKDILRGVVEKIAEKFGFKPNAEEADALVDSIGNWPVFPDTSSSLQELKKRFKLAVLSNVDDDLFEKTAARLKVEFDFVITAQQVGAYKPSQLMFQKLLDTTGLQKDQIIHLAQSRYHDIAPAKALGLRTIWINRRSSQPGYGATPPSQASADTEMQDLASLVSRVAKSLA